MGADFSRVRLNPLLDYAGVELKQGGVLLDADANELVGIVDRRLRALASDVLGRAHGVLHHARRLQDQPSRAAALQIGKGRLYVDGLLAENHGAVSDDPAKRVFDRPAGRARNSPTRSPTRRSPICPIPPALPTAGRHLVYLDVWDREVTHLEQPDLVESAVGVDATSRLQTVWQVRVLADDAGTGTTCATPDGDVPGWSDIIAPSTGVLTTGTFEVAPVDDPCELPPTGGYRGLENQLYRVEIHDPGQPGGARHLQVVARERQRRQPRRQHDLRRRARARRRSAATTCCRSRPATGSRSSTTCASSRRRPARCARSRWSRRRAASSSRRRCRPTMLPGSFPEQRLPGDAQPAGAPLGPGTARSSAPMRAARPSRCRTSTPRARPASSPCRPRPRRCCSRTASR